MSKEINHKMFTKALMALLLETFEKGEGIYLDRGTSFFETLNSVTAEEASRPIVEGGTTIAGHAEHARFYLRCLKTTTVPHPLGGLQVFRKFLRRSDYSVPHPERQRRVGFSLIAWATLVF